VNEAALLVNTEDIAAAERFRRQKSTAVLTVMFTDMARSTQLREELGEISYEQLRYRHDEVRYQTICKENAGAVIKHTGDGVLAVFAEPSVAVERALKIQSETRPDGQLRVRIGLDMGQVSRETEGGVVRDVFGRHVNRAARIQSLAEPQHTLVSFQVYDCAVGWLRSSEIKWLNHGFVPLKGFTQLVWIHEVFNPLTSSPQEILQHASGPPDEPSVVESKTGKYESLVAFQSQPVLRPAQDPLEFCEDSLKAAVKKFGPRQILWVDDYPSNNVFLSEMLQKAGFFITVARSTAEAQQTLREGRVYHLIISDMGRPESPTAGLDLLAWLRGERIMIPTVIFASGRAVQRTRQEALRLGAIECTDGIMTLLSTINVALLTSEMSSKPTNDVQKRRPNPC
jgi:class 3 adenylate cyclase/ActR/RegA family two-component response regulator